MDAATVGRLVGLALVLDAGTDATFALLALVRHAQAQGLKASGRERGRPPPKPHDPDRKSVV